MPHPRQWPSIECPAQNILGVWSIQHAPLKKDNTYSPPGHMVHAMLKGSYRLTVNGRRYYPRAGDVIYYHESENIEYEGLDEKTEYFSMAFKADGFAPLPLNRRIWRAGAEVFAIFEESLKAFRLAVSPARNLTLFRCLFALLEALERQRGMTESAPARGTWGEIEDALRRERLFRPTLTELSERSGRGPISLIRACRKETGLTPIRRVREIRMAEARGLAALSSMSVSEIAAYLGYPRVHEFSREYSRYFGEPPSALRKS